MFTCNFTCIWLQLELDLIDYLSTWFAAISFNLWLCFLLPLLLQVTSWFEPFSSTPPSFHIPNKFSKLLHLLSSKIMVYCVCHASTMGISSENIRGEKSSFHQITMTYYYITNLNHGCKINWVYLYSFPYRWLYFLLCFMKHTLYVWVIFFGVYICNKLRGIVSFILMISVAILH